MAGFRPREFEGRYWVLNAADGQWRTYPGETSSHNWKLVLAASAANSEESSGVISMCSDGF
jgi:hypothetical protein